MKKLVLMTVFCFLISGVSTAQCLPDNCSIVMTNKIDCDVVIRVTYNCPAVPNPPGSGPHQTTIALSPGNALTPYITTMNSHLTACPCGDMTSVSFEVISVAGVPSSPPVSIGSSATLLPYPGTCCTQAMYGSFSGCNFNTWMTCP